MKNTYIPLDMLSCAATVPLPESSPIRRLQPGAHPSGEPVWGVIEINAGEADDRGIHVGDKVVYNAAPVP